MKKNYLFGLFALATMLFTASCQEEDIAGINAGNSDVVTFAVNMKQTATTRAAALAGRGAQADKLYYGVYEKVGEKWELIPAISAAQEEGNLDPATITPGTPTQVEIKLAKQKDYSVIFWATNNSNNVCDVDWANRTMTMKTTGATANNEANDAFWAYETVVLNGAVAKTVDLYRPFAQLNIGASKADFKAAHDAQVDVNQSQIVLKKVANTFNMETGAASGKADVVLTYAYNAIPDSTAWKFPVAGHEYLAFGYVLVDTAKALVDVELAYNDAKGGAYNSAFTSVPVQRNYRTNIYGNLLSNSADYDVNLKPELGEEDTNIQVWDGESMDAPAIDDENKTVTVGLPNQLAWLAAAVNGTLPSDNVTRAVVDKNNFKGYTIKLESDINLGNQPWTPIGTSTNLSAGDTFQGTFDGQGFTITGLNVEHQDVAGLFGYVYGATIKNVTIEGATIKSNHYAGGVVAWVLNNKGNIQIPMVIENCHVKNSTITSTPEEVNGEWDNGDKVGGIVGYACYWSEDHGKNDGAVIKDCSVENTTIKAYRDFAGIVGYASHATIEKCSVKDITLEQDLTHDYKAPNTPTTFGDIIGRNDGGNTIDGEVAVASVEALQTAINAAEGKTTIALYADMEGNVTVVQKQGVKITIDGKGKKFNGSIKVHSNSNHYADAALTIRNVNFESSAASVNVIEALENGSLRYSTNITVEGCTFTATGEGENTSVGVQIKASKNAKVLNCTATNMHSLIQAQSCDETVVVEGCTINGKNGVAFKQVKAATVEGTTINAREYGIRFDGNIDNYGIVVKNNNITAYQPLIVRKMTGKNNTIKLEGDNTFTTDEEYQIVITNGSDDEEYVKPTGTYTLTGAEKYSYFPAPPVAKIGNTEYSSINEAIANWTNGTTLTLIADVTLSDVITLSSQEHHYLALGTYTMTAASDKNAIEIKSYGKADRGESGALTITADATNPGGINAGNKSCIHYKYDATLANNNYDRPIIYIKGGVFVGNSISSNGHNEEQDKCATFNISGGIFNCALNLTKAKLLISGGTFNKSVSCTGGGTSHRLIWGGKFKSFLFMTADDKNTKFWFGTSMAVSDVGLYIDDDNYLVVGGPVITEFGDKFAAKATNATKWSSYLKYSSAAEHGLYYTNADLAIQKHGEANVVLPQ